MIKKLSIIFLIVLSFIYTDSVLASTNTIPRTDDDLGISSDIVVDSTNKEFILNTPRVDVSEKVYDFADLFTDSEETELYDLITNYIEKTSIDFVVVTIDENPKSYYYGVNPSGVYADDFHDYNDFLDDCVVFLIDMDNRQFYISTSGKAILMYDDDRIDITLDYITEDMKSGNYFEAGKSVIDSFRRYESQGIPKSNRNCLINDDGNYECYRKVPYFSIMVWVLIIVIVVFLSIANSYKKIRLATNALFYVVKGKTSIDKRIDLFVTSHTSKVKINTSSNSSTHRGSSTHSSSSRSSHGGRGRGF